MKRVAAYCRVSTEQDDQLNSLENQKQYFEKYISDNVDWEFCGLYVDEGISGTSVEKRDGFKRMVADAENKKFDLLLTKEISRFARNTLDSIFYTRKLKGLGVGVVFMNDNINTLDNDAELRLTIMSSIAQEESRKTSERVKWGQKRLMERGVVFGAKALGYDQKNGKLTINENEAKTVRLIFDLYISGMGAHNISKELDNRGIPTPKGGTRWNAVRVLRILKNEKYVGILKQKKRITIDYLSHKRKVNEGEENFIIVENSHAPIIEKEIFDRVQNELARRKNVTVEKSRYSNRHVWSGKVKCAYCNSSFKRKINNCTSNSPQIIWQCSEAEKYGKEKINPQGKKVGCNCKIVPEWVLRENFLAVLNGVIESKDFVVRELKERVRRAIEECPNKSDELNEVMAGLDKIADKKTRLIDMHLDGLIKLAEYRKSYAQYDKQQEALQKRLAVLDSENKLAEDLKQKLDNIDQAIENLARLKEFGDSICSEVLHKVVVEGRDKMSFYLTTCENKDPAFFKIPLSIRQDLPM
ncbi:MAG: recombinase family protein [Candidatus Bathyarchaeota archaeon]|uniref:recombinase family protein n=1 Tax=Candidatus Bathycorpusculum sp. TaxID=2994959 RepID=UPI00282685A8|nr:recombinase family protein [Candidatus Termiticorpusculum sp.]MCL2256848.1 recombinase family protein [Candidatus Termiticorpusculum sp.]MCL2293041.1 recombinase family protein [Candidatus Termiticorpusculum sp.]